MPEQDPVLEPQWLLQLRTYCQRCQVRSSFGHALPSAFPSCPLLAGQEAVVVVWVLCCSVLCSLPHATHHPVPFLCTGSLQVQDDLAPEVALTQPEPWDTTATPGKGTKPRGPQPSS